ncbi:MAG: hypothetical protein ISR96_02230 [Nitrospira sp.]|nr:hypothetical protein [bacterium]MBL7048334.1 hypothetical protein [Nitrospira sp.]
MPDGKKKAAWGHSGVYAKTRHAIQSVSERKERWSQFCDTLDVVEKALADDDPIALSLEKKC